MRVLFGFCGVFSLIQDFPTGQVFIYLFKTVSIPYPPFTVFYTGFMRSKAEYFSEKGSLRKGAFGMVVNKKKTYLSCAQYGVPFKAGDIAYCIAF